MTKKKSKGRVVDFNKALEEKQRQAAEAAAEAEKAKEAAKATPDEEPVTISERSDASVKRRRKMKLRKIAVRTLIALVFVGVAALFAHNIIVLKMEQNELKAKQEKLEKKKKDLTEQKKQVSKPRYIEEEARKQLKMIKPGEILYILPDTDEDENTN